MPRDPIWYTLADPSDSTPAGVPIEALTQAGIAAQPLRENSPASPGIVFFTRFTPALCELVRRTSRNTVQRVLVVGLAGSGLQSRDSWQLLRCGASDVFSWDRSPAPALEVAERLKRWREVDRLMASPLVQNNLIGHSPAWVSVLRQIVEVARFTDSPVLVMGESGTGKELVARLIHSLDDRPQRKKLVVLDCTTVVPELSGSEFFGHERGAFTGATGPREGAFGLANRGTLFLDEVGELPLSLQAQLLRVVQERTYKHVGGNQWHSTAFRLVCATNRQLDVDVSAGRFRADLYYRIASVICRIPPLRERPGDIIPLFQHFYAAHHPGQEPPELDEPVREFLLRREYPGNVRDLKQLVARLVYRHVGPGPITVGDLPSDEWPAADTDAESWRDAAFEISIRRAIAQGIGLKGIGRLATETAIHIVLDEEAGNLQRAAQKLGITDRALQMRKAANRPNGAAPDLQLH